MAQNSNNDIPQRSQQPRRKLFRFSLLSASNPRRKQYLLDDSTAIRKNHDKCVLRQECRTNLMEEKGIRESRDRRSFLVTCFVSFSFGFPFFSFSVLVFLLCLLLLLLLLFRSLRRFLESAAIRSLGRRALYTPAHDRSRRVLFLYVCVRAYMCARSVKAPRQQLGAKSSSKQQHTGRRYGRR